ncbi:hypothetical protein [Legionella sp. CNM-4043-24]|uniref:hypothetical protein n=1 Tax=Legionella sp. CNM-4043-24 TaxID=3421646 RepID=UPI00403AE2DD
MPRYSNEKGIRAFFNRNRGKIELSSMLLSTGIGAGIGALLGTFVFPGIGTAIGAGVGAGFGFSASLLGVSLGRYFAPKGSSSREMAVAGTWLGSWGLGVLVGGLIGSVIPGFGMVLGAVVGGLISFAASLVASALIAAIRKRFFPAPAHVMASQYSDSAVELQPMKRDVNDKNQVVRNDPASSYSYSPVLTSSRDAQLPDHFPVDYSSSEDSRLGIN